MPLWREIVESLPDGVIVLSPTRELLALNSAAESLLSASHVTRQFTDRLLKQNPWLAGMATACLNTGQSLETPEASLTLDKHAVHVGGAVSPLLSRRSEQLGAIILLKDLSHQRGLERSMGGDQSVRLSPAGLAHEVKNPLTGIKGAAELLAGMFPADSRAQQYCELILHGVNRIASLVEQVLAVSAPGRLKQEPVNIHRVLHQALRTAGLFESPPPGIVIEQLFDPSLPELIGDAEALERVFVNLLRNAVDAIGHGSSASGRIRIRTAMEGQFRLSSGGKKRQFLRVEISDSGKGMTPDEMDQLFAPFFTTKSDGTGLGLVISQRTIALHGGKLWAERRDIDALADVAAIHEPGSSQAALRGMTFNVVLPFGTG
jgi:two-component system, NtrC family, nitrogen regulation sensor histidine kinase GlnL